MNHHALSQPFSVGMPGAPADWPVTAANCTTEVPPFELWFGVLIVVGVYLSWLPQVRSYGGGGGLTGLANRVYPKEVFLWGVERVHCAYTSSELDTYDQLTLHGLGYLQVLYLRGMSYFRTGMRYLLGIPDLY